MFVRYSSNEHESLGLKTELVVKITLGFAARYTFYTLMKICWNILVLPCMLLTKYNSRLMSETFFLSLPNIQTYLTKTALANFQLIVCLQCFSNWLKKNHVDGLDHSRTSIHDIPIYLFLIFVYFFSNFNGVFLLLTKFIFNQFFLNSIKMLKKTINLLKNYY